MTVFVRPACVGDIAAIARVQVDTSRHAYRDLLAPPLLANLSYRDRESVWTSILARDHQWILVAVDTEGGEERAQRIVGFVCAGMNLGNEAQYTGEISALYVLPESQGKGVGICLLRAAIERLLGDGHQSVCLDTLRGSSARTFYDRRGGTVLSESATVRDGHTVDKVRYGWPDLAALLVALSERPLPR
jgi:GNAT superfamily N-acetyltransferase